jgi:hypothetical protein
MANFNRFTWAFWPIVVVGGLVAVSRADPSPRRPGLIVVVALLLYPVGYYLLHIEERFLSPVCVLLLMLGAFVIGSLSDTLAIGPVRRVLATALLAFTFLYNPKWDPANQPWWAALNGWSIASQWGIGADYPRQAEALRALLPERAKVASVGQWGESLYLSYLLNLRYYGESRPRASAAEIEQSLKGLDVEYVLLWGASRYNPRVPELRGHGIANLRVLTLKTLPTTSPATQAADDNR